MNCKNCGKPLPSSGAICKFCGVMMDKDQITKQSISSNRKEKFNPELKSKQYGVNTHPEYRKEEDKSTGLVAVLIIVVFLVILAIIINVIR